MPQSLERHEIEVDGLRLSYVERAANQGSTQTPLLLLHGLIATSETFASLIAELPVDRRIIALDLPGAGFSERNLAVDVSFAGQARLVRNFMLQTGLKRPVLLGHSHGGAVSLRLAVSYPEALTALILLAPAHPWSGHERALIAFYLSRVGHRIAHVLPHMPVFLHRLAFRRIAGPDARCDRNMLDLYRRSGQVPGTIDHLLRLLTTWQADMRALEADLIAAPVQMPVLLIWGDRDPVVPVRTAPALEEHLLLWERFTLHRVGHLPNEERPAECGRLLRTWLVWLRTGAGQYASWRQAQDKAPLSAEG